MVDEGQEVVSVGAGGVPQVDDRHLVAVVLQGHSAIVPGQIPFCIKGQEAHPAGAGVLHVGVEKERRLAHAGRADHQAVDVVAVNQGGDLLDRVVMIRRQIALELGTVVPIIRLRDNIQLNPQPVYHQDQRGAGQ